ncbi:DUF2236 domain-containing protein [Dyadobacter chenwenxiniae]|uniref:DUF2236 domain-containing protein n=1 Tax=Dyadobacter chenwenxiniae TaxID=2906456 RepID=A0A9X1TDE7_9BACT|nr:oxygenase MpaB family protein [Dyadobacter chenwenxiniae]MCF0060265.1 DUF2236 domain-containing protein [Dyadobacter chenwenxiniae]UON86003.1 DUF2236 domain-containing protein [Dyadobacter chenwenxiniae]
MKWFVKEGSVVREIWGKADTILFIFAGASAEFAVNKSVDWLYFTGKLPADPLGRLFSTVSYARRIVFSEHQAALKAIDQISAIHREVEHKRGAQIPDWAYRDVLFMLIDYSIRSFELLERKLTANERTEVFEVFQQVGARMGIRGLPENYNSWLEMRNKQLDDNFVKSSFSVDLYKQYKKHLGSPRYLMLREVQVQIVPRQVRELLALRRWSALTLILPTYKFTRILHLHKLVRGLILPEKYKVEIAGLDAI